MKKNPETPEIQFSDLLAEIGHGATNRIATDRLKEIITACKITGKKGAITIRIDVGVSGGLAEMRASVKTTKPESALPGSTYFATDDGDLAHEDPRQTILPLKSIEAPPTNLRNINPKE